MKTMTRALGLAEFGLLDNPNDREYAHKQADIYQEHGVELVATEEDTFKRDGVEATLYRRLTKHVDHLQPPE